MNTFHSPSRRTLLRAGITAAAGSMLPGAAAEAGEAPPAKKPGSTRISAICGEDHRVRNGLRQTMTRLPDADFWWADNYQPVTPAIIGDTDLLLTYYSGYMYTEENIAAIKRNVTERGMGWICVHNTPWFVGDELNEFIGAYAMLHREIQPVAIAKLDPDHPITHGIEPFVINLDEQFGAYLADPDDPDLTVLFWSQGLHDGHWTIQGWCVQRGRGRIVGLTPGHYEWTWYEDQYQVIMWRAAQWALNIPIQPYFSTLDNFIW